VRRAWIAGQREALIQAFHEVLKKYILIMVVTNVLRTFLEWGATPICVEEEPSR